jgi:rubrerythrin
MACKTGFSEKNRRSRMNPKEFPMNEWKTADDILDFAINNEQNAVDFYRELASKAAKP